MIPRTCQLLILLVLIFCCNAFSQTGISSIIPITAEGYTHNYDTGTYVWTQHLYFGNHIRATCGVDSLSPTMIEQSCPPDACDIAWSGSCGFQLYPFDIRNIPTNTAQADTFRLSEWDGIGPHMFKWVLSWPDSNYLRSRCDSMFFIDPLSNVGRVNMFTAESISISYPDDISYDQYKILKYGVHLVDEVGTGNPILPKTFSLEQNFPNPLNPSTTISFVLPKSSFVTLKIYNVLGQLISTLVNERRAPGMYNVQFDASNLPSGVYYYRLSAGEFVQARKMLVIK